ncbi:MAG: hypothetical protein B6D56_02215 [Candidatus Omnitrophica bacterium 4484_70.1]|nr:MAG: hypothetical protein B6D56_02215 [Candidatus Omnitrophica bacterium 4484_70.1]
MRKDRINKFLKKIEKLKLDAFLLSNPVNINYLTYFNKELSGYLIISAKKLIYLTYFVYFEEAKKNKMWETKLIENKNIFKEVAAQVKKMKVKRVGFETKHFVFAEYKKLKEELSKKEIEFVETFDLVEEMRMIKEKEEINLVKKATKITLEGFNFLKEIIQDSFSEKFLAQEVEKFLKIKGDIKLAFPPIVAFGKNSSFPHHLPTQEKLRKNKLILVDIGARYRGYCADLTRVFFWDKMPPQLKKIYELVKKAQEESIKNIKPGKKAKEIDKAGREIISKKGWGRFFGHGLGHGVGLEVHERPFLSPKSEDILEENMIVTIEPAVYIPHKFGIRIESMVRITDRGAEIIDETFHS